MIKYLKILFLSFIFKNVKSKNCFLNISNLNQYVDTSNNSDYFGVSFNINNSLSFFNLNTINTNQKCNLTLITYDNSKINIKKDNFNYSINIENNGVNNSLILNYLDIDSNTSQNFLFSKVNNNSNYNIIDNVLIYNSFNIYSNSNLIDNNITMSSKELKKTSLNNFFQYFIIDRFNYYIIVLISYVVFILLTLFLFIISKRNRKIFDKNINIYYFGYISFGSLVFIINYTIWWIGLLIYSFLENNRLVIMDRLGILITLNTLLLIFPIFKNSIWLVLFDVSKEKINHIHRFVSTTCLLSVIIKFIAALIMYDINFLILLINPTTGGSPLFGILATIFFLLIGFLSIPFIRNKSFELFYYSHRILVFVIIIFSTLHYMVFLYYVLPAVSLYIFDLFLRLRYTYNSLYSKLKNIGNVEKYTIINITLEKKITTYPGNYFLLCFYDNISQLQWHPLSLVVNKDNTLVFCCKNNGKNSWTSRLFNEVEYNYTKLINRKVYIQGPYGNFNLKYQKNKYSNIIIIGGGIGITALISLLEDISTLYSFYKLNKLKKVIFIWILKDESLIYLLNKYFLIKNKIIDIQIYITGSNKNITSTRKLNFDKESDIKLQIEKLERNNNTTIKYEKPNITHFLESFFKQHINNAVFECGPKKLSDEIINICTKFDIDIVSENF
jgi:NAD(P)H-flavin reductase